MADADLSGPGNNPLLFWFGCIPVRTALVALPSFLERDTLSWKLYLGAITSMGVGLLVFATGRAQGWIPMRGAGGQYAYWDSTIHGALYLFAAWYLATGRTRLAQVVLAADIFVGISQVVLKRYL